MIPLTFDAELDSAVADLSVGAQRLTALGMSERCALLDLCASSVSEVADLWVQAACQAKRIAFDQAIAGEEILAGPSSVMRYLRVLQRVFQDVDQTGSPRLPAAPRKNALGRLCVPVMPIGHLYDRLIFRGLRCEVWLQDAASTQSLFGSSFEFPVPRMPQIAGVLGAGNVSAIPATDALHKIFFQHQAVLLKLNPVNEYLEPIFQRAFRPLIAANLLRIVQGGPNTGAAIVQHPRIDELHLTGSHQTHDAIVWGSDLQERARRQRDGDPLVTKTITSELGNVTPWVIVPGKYSAGQLRSQAEHLAASIVNNASFNCIATKMIVTSRHWPQREAFLDMVDALLQRTPARFAYYPGARQRFERAAGRLPDRDDDSLPWMLIRDTQRSEQPHLFDEESFVCVCAETMLDEASCEAFLDAAVDFVNLQLFGTLGVTLTVTDAFRRRQANHLDRAIDRLRYGSVCINQWSGIAYGLMTPPWGGYHDATLAAPQSGIGHVHNTFGLANIDKAVLMGPLCSWPKPVWFPTHQTAHQVGRSLIQFYRKPSLVRLPSIFYPALLG